MQELEQNAETKALPESKTNPERKSAVISFVKKHLNMAKDKIIVIESVTPFDEPDAPGYKQVICRLYPFKKIINLRRDINSSVNEAIEILKNSDPEYWNEERLAERRENIMRSKTHSAYVKGISDQLKEYKNKGYEGKQYILTGEVITVQDTGELKFKLCHVVRGKVD